VIFEFADLVPLFQRGDVLRTLVRTLIRHARNFRSYYAS
jgi:hypothetical protein